MPDYFKIAQFEAGERRVMEIPSDRQRKQTFTVRFFHGALFRALSVDAEMYPMVNGKKLIYICLSIFSDKSLATASCSEQPVAVVRVAIQSYTASVKSMRCCFLDTLPLRCPT